LTAVDPRLRILEIGEFSLIMTCLPEQTTLIFTGANARRAPALEHRSFSPTLAVEIIQKLRRGDWDLVFCHPPAQPLWDPRRGVVGGLSLLTRLAFRFRTLGTYVARVGGIPLIVLDLNDMSSIPAPGVPLLDESLLYFKRELPLDPAKALFNVAPRFRTHKRVATSRFFERNRDKLQPISSGVPESTAEIAKDLRPEKTVDVFFAGSAINSEIRRRGFEELKALRERGYVVDVSSGGLTRQEYLERCARSWLTWSPEGYGWECFRHYEASLCRSVPILSAPGILRYQPLEDGIHAHMYPARSGGLAQKIEAALSDKAALARMAERARLHVLTHHTFARISEHVIASSLDLLQSREQDRSGRR